MQSIQNLNVAKSVSNKIAEKKTIINTLLLKKNESDYRKVNIIINGIISEFNLTGVIDIIFGIDIRNSKLLSERKNHIEMIISPIFKKDNLDFINILYKELTSNKRYICDNWSIVKYKPWNPETLENIQITYSNKDGTTKTITHKDIEYYSYEAESNSNKSINYEKINVILFICDDVKQYILEKHTISGNEVYIPKDSSILTLLDAAIGEYNILNIINHMEICLQSTNIPFEKLPLLNLRDKIKMIDTVINTTNKIYNCTQCDYLNTHVELIKCKCNKVYYCDDICKNAHFNIHKNYCNYTSVNSSELPVLDSLELVSSELESDS